MKIRASIAATVLGLMAGAACSSSPEPKTVRAGQVETTTSTAAVSFANCDAVREAGKAPIRQGDPGYSTRLDGDGDGVACDTPTTTTTAKPAVTTTTAKPKPPTTTTTAPEAEKLSMRVGGLDAPACDAYAAKQSRLNPDRAAWTWRMDGATCVVTEG